MGVCSRCKHDFGSASPKFCTECGFDLSQQATEVVEEVKDAPEHSGQEDTRGEPRTWDRQDARDVQGKQGKAPLVLGIIALVLCWIPVVGIILGAIALVLAIRARKNMDENDRKPVASLVLGIVALALSVILTIAMCSPTDSSDGTGDDAQNAAQSADEQGTDSDDSKDAAKDTAKSPVISITASYSGSRSEGVLLDDNSWGIKVTGTCEDNTTCTIDDWDIPEPVTLVADQTSTVTITYGDLSCTLDVTCSTVSPAAYKAQCEWPSYDDLLRYPDDWKNHKVAVRGQISQVMNGTAGSGTYLVYITESSYGGYWYEGVTYITYDAADEGLNLLEDDIVTFYGEACGTMTYETVLGAEKTVPSIKAIYADLG